MDLTFLFLFTGLFVWINHNVGPDQYERWFWTILVSLFAFVVTNGAVARGVHHLTGVNFAWRDLFDSPLLQTLYAVLWSGTALALMVAASRRQSRPLWFGGAALLALTVLKLFIVDLSSVETLWRIVSFLGVGTLVLIIGYFVPLPPGSEDGREATPQAG